MSAPRNKLKESKRFKTTAIFVVIAILYSSLHLSKVWKEDSVLDIDALVQHMFFKPIDIFPINSQILGIGFGIAIIVVLLMYQYHLNKRNMRPDEESGSAKWNENFSKYYCKYADGSMKYSLPKPKGKGIISRILRDFIGCIERILFGRTYKVNEDTGGNDTWTFTENKDGYKVYAHKGTKNMILSQDVVMSMNTRQTLRNNNTLVIGGSGTGKSRFVIKPNMLQANSSFVITDPSGELLEALGDFLKEKGYEIKVFNLVQMDHSNCYNPFAYIRNEEGVLTMINALIKNTTPKGSSSNDPFWEKAETALLQAICFYLIAECNPDDQNFNSVMKLLRCVEAGENAENQESVLDVLMNELREKDPEHIALQSYAVFKSAGGGKTAQSILISCQTRLQVFNLKVIKNLTNKDNLDLKAVGDKPTALFCITPVVDTTFNFLVALLYTQLFETLYYHAETECNAIYHQGLRLPIHVRFMLDEFANIGTIPEFPQKLSTMRKYEISCTIVIQALSQLKAMYKDDWEVLVGNCDSTIFLGGSDATTLEYISKKLGKETIRAKNTSRSYGRSGSSSESYNTTGRELMQPDEIARMDNINSIIFIRGVLPFFSKKYEYTNHPNYRLTGDADSSKGFDVKKTVNTVEPTLSKTEVANKKRAEYRDKAKHGDAIVSSEESSKELKKKRAKRDERNAVYISHKENEIKNNMDFEAATVGELIEKNDLACTEEQINEAIAERYTPDEISAPVGMSEFDTEPGMSGSLDESLDDFSYEEEADEFEDDFSEDALNGFLSNNTSV